MKNIIIQKCSTIFNRKFRKIKEHYDALNLKYSNEMNELYHHVKDLRTRVNTINMKINIIKEKMNENMNENINQHHGRKRKFNDETSYRRKKRRKVCIFVCQYLHKNIYFPFF